MDTGTAWKKSRFIQSDRMGINMIDILSTCMYVCMYVYKCVYVYICESVGGSM